MRCLCKCEGGLQATCDDASSGMVWPLLFFILVCYIAMRFGGEESDGEEVHSNNMYS